MTQSFVHKYTGNLSTQPYRKSFKTRRRLHLGFSNKSSKEELIRTVEKHDESEKRS